MLTPVSGSVPALPFREWGISLRKVRPVLAIWSQSVTLTPKNTSNFVVPVIADYDSLCQPKAL